MPDTHATRTMSPATIAVDIPPPPPRQPVQWRRAVRALRELLDDPDRTEKAFEIFLAIDGDSQEREFQRFIAHPNGRRLLAERPSLIGLLADRTALASMPAGSFGRAYLDYLECSGLDPAGLLTLKTAMEEQAQRAGENRPQLDPAREWLSNRTILMHDLWHVLTGYGTDEAGEAALLPFTYAQAGGRANALLVTGVLVRGTFEAGIGFARYLYQAWQRGRHAVRLSTLSYEALLPLPLEEVRHIAAILPATVAHPAGIIQGSLERHVEAGATP